MDFNRTPLKPVNRPFTPQNLSDATLDRLLGDLKKQNQLKKFGAPSTRLCAAVDHIVTNKQLPPYFQDDWISFIKLAIEVLSAKRVKKQCHASFQTFLSVADTLPNDACLQMSRSLMFYKNPDPAVQALVGQLQRSVDHAFLREQERIKLDEVRRLERFTAIPRERGDARYPAAEFTDLPDLQKFMQSDDVEIRLYGFNGIADARRQLKALAPRLPQGSMYEALGKGKRAYVAIEKPCWSKRRDWKAYCDHKMDLQKARSELATIQSEMRRAGLDSSTATASKKRRIE